MSQTVGAETVKLSPQGGVYHIFNRAVPAAADGKINPPVVIGITGDEPVTLSAEDIDGKAVNWSCEIDPRKHKETPAAFPFDAGMGFYRIVAKSDGKEVGSTEIAIVPPFHPGVRKDSFFGSNTSNIKIGDDLKLLQAIGMKIQRTHFQPPLLSHGPAPSIGLDFKTQDAHVAESIAHDTWFLPIVGYTLDGRKTAQATKFKMHGPPADYNEFVANWKLILEHYPDITTWEFWNEPWIFIWTWADTPARYRELQVQWCKMALSVNPHYEIIVGNSSMFVEDHIEPYPECWKGLITAISHHPYTGAEAPNWRSGANQRSIDYIGCIARRMGLPFYLTEGGTTCGSDSRENAVKIVQYYVRAALSGSMQGDMQWELGYGPKWTRPNASFAVMTHFLEDRPPVADIWPENELLWGGIFANPKFVTDEVRKLPRAKELSARWNVPIPPDRAGDDTKVAVIWSLTGEGNGKLDKEAKLSFLADPDDLIAFDFMGRRIAQVSGTVSVPLGRGPVYVTSKKLSVVELRERIHAALDHEITPINMYPLSLLRPATDKQQLYVRLENQLPYDLHGTLTIRIGGVEKSISAPFEIQAARLDEIAVPWPGIPDSANNQYGIELSASVGDGLWGEKSAVRMLPYSTRRQTIEVARVAHRTVRINGKLDDWQGVTPIALFKAGDEKEDPIAYLLNPHLERPKEEASSTAKKPPRVWFAYDDKFVYVAAQGIGTKPEAGKISREGLPYRKGWPDGLEHPATIGHSLIVSFGFRDRVPGYGRQMDDPWAWKGYFNDTDYQYIAYPTTDGPRLVRQWGPDTNRANGFQIDPLPHIVDVPGGQIVINEECYEIAIPRSELKMFDPKQERCRIGILIDGKMNWAHSAGVFDYWGNLGSFAPTWIQHLPCQTYFGIEK